MAIVCPNCNFAGNPDNAERCQLCNSPFGQTTRNIPSPTHEESIPTAEPPQNQLVGRITWIETTTENIDFNWYRFLSQVILFLMFLPLLFVIFAISFALWISLSILGFRTFSSAISPFNVANSINSLGILLAVVFPRVPQRNQVPTVRLTVQTLQGERAAIIKGELISGTFRRGDEVEIDGRWRNGTLVMQRGYNRTLRTCLVLRRDYWRFMLIGLLSLILILGILFGVNYK